MQKLIRMTAISSLVFGALTVHAAGAAAAERVFFDEADTKTTVTIHGPGLPAEGSKAPAWVARKLDTLQDAIVKAYQAAGLCVMPSTDLGPISTSEWGSEPSITAETDFAMLAHNAKVTGVNIYSSISASMFLKNGPVAGVEGFFDAKDTAELTIHGPGLKEPAKVQAWVARSYPALQDAIVKAYQEAGLFLMPATDIGTITDGYTAITPATDFGLLASNARIGDKKIFVTIAASVFGARI